MRSLRCPWLAHHGVSKRCPDWPVHRSKHHCLIEKDKNESFVFVRTGRGRVSEWSDSDVRKHGRATRVGCQRLGNYRRKSHDGPAVVVIPRCDAEQHSAPNPHSY